MKATVMSVVTGDFSIVTKGLIKGLVDLEIRGNHPNNSIIKIDQNTEKNPGNSRKLAVT